jgi:hypothetical protein
MSSHDRHSLFIWYVGSPDLLTDLREWLIHLRELTGYHGTLYLRETKGETTYMEVFHAVGLDAQERIEQLAARRPCFEHVHRHCEAFTPDKEIP